MYRSSSISSQNSWSRFNDKIANRNCDGILLISIDDDIDVDFGVVVVVVVGTWLVDDCCCCCCCCCVGDAVGCAFCDSGGGGDVEVDVDSSASSSLSFNEDDMGDDCGESIQNGSLSIIVVVAVVVFS